MNRKEFEKHVREAIDRIPDRFQQALKNIAIVIVEFPGPESEGVEGGWECGLYGLYQGIPLPERTLDDSGTMPDVIYLYQKPLEEDFPSREELIREIEVTVVHEIAHYFGIDEETLERHGYD
ncbi:MAG TPA: metallopeptidase family protein [Nitrospiria bacterium]